MLHFRTILLWLAFILIALQQIWDFNGNYLLGMVYRLLPSAVLLLWFVLSIFFNESEKLKSDGLSNTIKKLILILRPLASVLVIIGALLKIMHWPYGNIVLALGIGVLAVYSTIISIYGYRSSDEPNDIIDDLD